MKTKTKGMTVLRWENGKKVRVYFEDAVRQGCKYYIGEQFDVLFDNQNRVICALRNIIAVEDHNG